MTCIVSQRAFNGVSCNHVQWVNTNLKSILGVWNCVLPLYFLQNNGQPNKQLMSCLVVQRHFGVVGLISDADKAWATSQFFFSLCLFLGKYMRWQNKWDTFSTVITHHWWVGKSPLDMGVEYCCCLLIRLSHNFWIKAQEALVLAHLFNVSHCWRLTM